MAEGTISDQELAELVRRTEEATSAFMRGDMERYLALTSHARGFTLLNPLGGPPAGVGGRARLGRHRGAGDDRAAARRGRGLA